MVTVGVVFEKEGYPFSGKAHQLKFVEFPQRRDTFHIDYLENEMDDSLTKDLDLVKFHTFEVKRRVLVSSNSPGMDIFATPIDQD
tara:strand:+ start:9127 stop:9381 length:255 start_codon:yes stop_codon:yes gene_type:complete